jgi:hypothetical protein
MAAIYIKKDHVRERIEKEYIYLDLEELKELNAEIQMTVIEETGEEYYFLVSTSDDEYYKEYPGAILFDVGSALIKKYESQFGPRKRFEFPKKKKKTKSK